FLPGSNRMVGFTREDCGTPQQDACPAWIVDAGMQREAHPSAIAAFDELNLLVENDSGGVDVMNALSGPVHTAGVDLLRGPLGVEETALTPIGASYVFRGAAGVWDLGTLQVPGADLLLPQPNGHALAWAGDALFHIESSST